MNFFIAYLTQLKLTYVVLLELCSLGPRSCRRGHTKDASNQILVKILLSTTTSHLCQSWSLNGGVVLGLILATMSILIFNLIYLVVRGHNKNGVKKVLSKDVRVVLGLNELPIR